MRGLWLQDGALELRDDLPVAEPASDEALVQVLAAGICNTDLELLRGYHAFTGIPGHEFVGVIAAGSTDHVGCRVVGEINLSCGSCGACRRGHRTHCQHRRVLGLRDHHGAFAEYLTLPIDNLHRVPDSVTDDAAVFVEPLAAALEIQRQVEIGPDHRVALIGSGKLGSLIAKTLALTGCELFVVGRQTPKRDLFSNPAIATGRIDDLEPASFDVAIECTGNEHGFAVARHAVRPRGTVVLKSTYMGRLSLDASTLVVDEITVVGSRCGPFEPAVDLLARGEIEVESLIEDRLPLSRGSEAFDIAGRRGALKVLLQP